MLFTLFVRRSTNRVSNTSTLDYEVLREDNNRFRRLFILSVYTFEEQILAPFEEWILCNHLNPSFLSLVLRLLRYLTVLRTGTLHTAVDLFGQSYTAVSKDVTVIGKAFARCFYAKYIRPITPYSPEWAYHRTSQDSAFMYILV